MKKSIKSLKARAKRTNQVKVIDTKTGRAYEVAPSKVRKYHTVIDDKTYNALEIRQGRVNDEICYLEEKLDSNSIHYDFYAYINNQDEEAKYED